MKKVARFIVKFSKAIIILFIALIAYSVISIPKVNIEYSVNSYLPNSTDTKRALDIMDEEFVTYGTSTIIIRNISYEDASSLRDEIIAIPGVKDLPFENTSKYYASSSALFTITYDGTEDDAECVEAYNKVISLMEGYDALVSASLVDNYASQLKSDINRILVLAVIIIIIVLLFTSNSYAEVIVFMIVFGVSALLNMGTNYWFGTISFISNSVCVILQLALAIDYAIILSHRFAEEKLTAPNSEEAMVEALSKAIVEISSSSLTTISGLLALCCMSLKLGQDLGLVLAKSIICSMFTVFLLMPSLMLMFSKMIDKSSHKSFVPNISIFGKGVIKLRYVNTIAFIALVCGGAYFSNQINYVYSQSSIDTSSPTEEMIAKQEINEIFGSKNQFVVLVPKGDYAVERHVVDLLEDEELINEVTGISNVKLTSNGISHYLIDELNYIDFADFLGVDQSISKSIYYSYAFLSKDETNDSIEEVAVFEANPDKYTMSILDLCDCAFKYDDFIEAYLSDEQETLDNYYDIKDQITDAEDQLIGTNYTRIVCNITSEVEAKETFALIERLQKSVKGYNSGCIFAGDSMASYDLNASFSTDNLLISLLTIGFVYVILVFTFKNWALPILLVAVIQGAIFINFSIPYLSGNNLYFFVYLIVSSIQMGATIDYAIVITNRYQELETRMNKKEALIASLNESFPTIITSGTILVSAAYLINFLVSDPLISTLGLSLGRGTLISIASVLIVLPCLLYFFYKGLSKAKIPEIDTKKLISNIKEKMKDENIKNNDSSCTQ